MHKMMLIGDVDNHPQDHLASGELGKVKEVNVVVKGSPSPPIRVTQLFFQH